MLTAIATSIPISFIAWQLVISILIGSALALPIGTKLFKAFSEKAIRAITCTLITIALFDLLIEAVNLYSQLPTTRSA